MDIRCIDKESAWRIRHEVMWPDRELEYVQLKDDDRGRHYGLFAGERLVSVVSLFMDQDEAQFRKFATLEEEQGKGYGSRLLRYVMEEAQQAGVKRIWCNARWEKTFFYRKFGLLETDRAFVKGGKEYVIMECNMK
ncbi:GNAT family N-acetyltransferase [Paenibacillus sp. P96]|uniref:GNAT family N-acetyltransferase n=1 Tax=Paenibacillus zeirhizosphaerae TaxID=2987519 RepID=A0ABT9FTC1_9BACL|nr:GNAT family N-acetyltransferase [Paenibacillus sp. P96]MDP4097982.1 GNAT family N-acetyltransferase [Paenibacillus sp. P96]